MKTFEYAGRYYEVKGISRPPVRGCCTQCAGWNSLPCRPLKKAAMKELGYTGDCCRYLEGSGKHGRGKAYVYREIDPLHRSLLKLKECENENI